MSKYEKEQENLRKLWDEVDLEEEPDSEPNDDEEELAFEENALETRSTDSESEQECDDSGNDNIPPTKLPRIPTFIGKNGTTRWNKHCPNKIVRTRKENIIVRLPGVRNCGKNAKTAIECWSLFFTDEMLSIIVENTNLYISRLAEGYTRERRGKLTDLCEIKAFLVYYIWRGL